MAPLKDPLPRLLQDSSSERTALIDASSGQTVSYAELVAVADGIAARVGQRKSLLFVLSRNDLITAHTYAAALRGHHALAFLDGGRPVTDYADLIVAYRPSRVAGPVGSADRLRDVGLPVRSVDALFGGELVELDQPQPAQLHPDLAILLPTSGTTGSRRYVRLSRGNVEANAASIARYLALDDAERPITSLPLHYSFGLSVLHSHWLAGAAVVLTDDSVMETSFWEALERHACTSLAGVPFTYQQLERIGYRQRALSTVMTMQQAGGALDRHLTRLYGEHMRTRGGRLVVMYGQTEATARMAYVPPHRLIDKLGSAGIAIPGGRFRVEPMAHPSAREEVGEIVYEGPNVMMGYASGYADLGRGDELGGQLHTGDLGYLDGEGYLYVVGRSKRIAKVYGVRISLDELEATLREHGPAALVGAEDAIIGYCAFGTEASLESVRREIASLARVNRRAVRLQRVAEIPTTTSGKTDYQRLTEWSAGDHSAPSGRGTI